MANLFIRTYTFVDGTTAYGSQVEAEIGNIVTVLNSLNSATTTWGQVSIAHATAVPLIADCSAGTQHIADFKNNSVIKASVSSAGLVTCVGVTSSDNIVFSPTTKGVKGTTTNDNAAALNVGEYVSSVIALTNIAVASGTYFDVTSISLTAGDWDISVNFNILRNAATFTALNFQTGATTTTGASSTGLVDGDNLGIMNVGASLTTFGEMSIAVPGFRVSLGSTTTYYLKGFLATFTAGTPQYAGRISARRVR